MEAHAADLRAEVQDESFVDRFTRDRHTAGVGEADEALHDFAEKLTREPWTVTKADLDDLRRCGFSDEQLSDAVQVISYFNYINRMADGLGVDLEDFMPPQRAE